MLSAASLCVLTTAALCAGGTDPSSLDDPMLRISARMPDGAMSPGEVYEFTVALEVGDADAERFGWTLDEPDRSIQRGRPILQIDVPDSIELTESGPADAASPEDVLTSYLGMPYGRRLLTAETTIAFRLTREPEADDVIGLNVIAYLGDGSREDARFVRRRVHLPVSPGAKAIAADPSDSSWGTANHLHISDVAEDFTLPGTDGESVTLSSLRGQTVIVTTYRGQW